MAAVSPMELPNRAYTIHDMVELNSERWPRYEVLDGILVVSPAPSSDHQILSDNLQTLLTLQAPSGETVISASNLRLHADERGTVPDLIVLYPEVETARRTWFEADEVLAVVEVVSPGNRTHDRVTKTAIYAEAGIPYYLRTELAPFQGQGSCHLPVILVQKLDRDGYQEVERLSSGAVGSLARPFPLKVDPASLLDPRWQRSLYAG
ncbi:Uma2 family endonuclease [Actinomadura harenae]|nr:Uma2 family endonuclease [Actinomadura harenae]